jgi:hypothetical protein
MKQAKITKGKAEQIALAKVSHGIVKSAEIDVNAAATTD